jgi:hypothetical protein
MACGVWHMTYGVLQRDPRGMSKGYLFGYVKSMRPLGGT